MSEFQYAGGLTLNQVKHEWRKAIDSAGLNVPKGMAMVRPPLRDVSERWGVAIVMGGASWRAELPMPIQLNVALAEAAQSAKEWADEGFA